MKQLGLAQGSGEILLTAGAFSKFLCSDDSSIAADFPLQGCADLADKLIVRTSDSSIQLAFNNVDAAGAPLELDGGIQPQVCFLNQFHPRYQTGAGWVSQLHLPAYCTHLL